ncbi:MAG: hypothetical protein ABIP55_06615, partial [Tepidisphaeraceae bacterium]
VRSLTQVIFTLLRHSLIKQAPLAVYPATHLILAARPRSGMGSDPPWVQRGRAGPAIHRVPPAVPHAEHRLYPEERPSSFKTRESTPVPHLN